ncbi:hypothetical protein DFH09DRAFT_1384197 [Mycena vulgaris]|nr:hypothetical protein DFH09DRAFT_1384197 [Mycena vulgaris]
MVPAERKKSTAQDEAATKAALWQKDKHATGQATCPECGERKKYGPGGIANLELRHLETATCIEKARKRDKQPRQNGSIFSFLGKKVPTVPATVKTPALVVSRTSAQTSQTNPAPITGKTSAAPAVTTAHCMTPSPRLVELLHQLRENCRRLPLTVPEADESNPLAVFSADPASYVGATVSPAMLWEELAATFHKAFDYGKGPEDRVDMIQTGLYGLGGFLRFLEYFVISRGLEGAMVELKVEQLLETLKLVTRKCGNTDGETLEPTPSPSVHVVIDVDDYTEPDIQPDATPNPRNESSPCKGFVLPHGLDYPFGLHTLLSLPWGVEYSNGVVTLRSHDCQKTTANGRSNCRPCADLSKESTVQGIMNRAEDGVHENVNFAYHGVTGLAELLRRKNQRIQELRLHGLSIASKVITQARSLSDYKRLVTAIGSGVVQRVDRVVGIAIGRKSGVRGILRVHDDAARGVYHPKSFTEVEDMRALLIWKLAGNRVADIVHRSMGLPSRTTLRKRETVPPLVPSPGKPQASEVAQNVEACFESIIDVLAAKKVVHQVLMYDKLATEKRIRWDHKTNNFLGVCREHAFKTNLQFNSEQDLEELFDSLLKTPAGKKEPEVHYAGEATVAALGILSDETRLYAARPVLVSGDCKKETGSEHVHNILNPTIDGVNSKRELTKLRIVSLASDGESRRGKAFIEKTFIRELSPDSNIYELLKDLPLMNLWVGEDDITSDKDHKHVFKRGRNRLLRKARTDVMGVHITPGIIRIHLQSVGHSMAHINSAFNPEDKQDVKLVFKFLQDIWSLPLPPDGSSPGFRSARHALRLIGSLFYHLVFPYICIDLTLSEQLEHLSAAAHLALILYRDGQKRSLPTLLFTDIMIMIKNAYFASFDDSLFS